MSLLVKAQPFPNLYLGRPDGTALEIFDLRKRRHAVVLTLDKPDPDVHAFIAAFQARAKLFDWLETTLLPVYARVRDIPTPWPAPAYPPCLLPGEAPQGLEWGRAYVVSKHGTLLEIYEEPAYLSADALERDVMYWEAGHCLP